MQEFIDSRGRPFSTEKPREAQFIEHMEEAGIPWRTYSGRGMMGRECPAAVTSDEFSEQDIIRATSLNGLRTDSMGRRLVLYTG